MILTKRKPPQAGKTKNKKTGVFKMAWWNPVSAARNLWNSASSAASNAWQSATSTASRAVNTVRETVNTATETVRETARNVSNSIRLSIRQSNHLESTVRDEIHSRSPLLSRALQVGETLQGFTPAGMMSEINRIGLSWITRNSDQAEAQAERMLMRNKSASRGVINGIVSLFGSDAEKWVDERIQPSPESLALLRRYTGIDLRPRTAEQRALVETANGTGYAGGIVASIFAPGGAFARVASVGLRGASLISNVARLPRIAEAANALAHSAGALRGLTGWRQIGVGLADYFTVRAIGGTVFSFLGAGALATAAPATAAMPQQDGNAPIVSLQPNASTVEIPARTVTVNTERSDPVISSIFTASVQNNGYLTNDAIHSMNNRVRQDIDPSRLNQNDRAAYAEQIIQLANDFERNPPQWGDPRVAQMQTALFALGYGRDNTETGQRFGIDGIWGSQTDTAMNAFITDLERNAQSAASLQTTTGNDTTRARAEPRI